MMSLQLYTGLSLQAQTMCKAHYTTKVRHAINSKSEGYTIGTIYNDRDKRWPELDCMSLILQHEYVEQTDLHEQTGTILCTYPADGSALDHVSHG